MEGLLSPLSFKTTPEWKCSGQQSIVHPYKLLQADLSMNPAWVFLPLLGGHRNTVTRKRCQSVHSTVILRSWVISHVASLCFLHVLEQPPAILLYVVPRPPSPYKLGSWEPSAHGEHVWPHGPLMSYSEVYVLSWAQQPSRSFPSHAVYSSLQQMEERCFEKPRCCVVVLSLGLNQRAHVTPLPHMALDLLAPMAQAARLLSRKTGPAAKPSPVVSSTKARNLPGHLIMASRSGPQCGTFCKQNLRDLRSGVLLAYR